MLLTPERDAALVPDVFRRETIENRKEPRQIHLIFMMRPIIANERGEHMLTIALQKTSQELHTQH